MKKIILSALFLTVSGGAANALCHTTTFGIAILSGAFGTKAALAAGEEASGLYLGTSLSTMGGRGHRVFGNMATEISLGWAFKNGLRVEADFLSSVIMDGEDNHSHGHGHSHGFNLNFGLQAARLLYDVKTGYRVRPFFGVMVGHMQFPDEWEYNIAAIAGFSTRLTDSLLLDAQYEYNFNRHHGHAHNMNNFRVGLRSFF